MLGKAGHDKIHQRGTVSENFSGMVDLGKRVDDRPVLESSGLRTDVHKAQVALMAESRVDTATLVAEQEREVEESRQRYAEIKQRQMERQAEIGNPTLAGIYAHAVNKVVDAWRAPRKDESSEERALAVGRIRGFVESAKMVALRARELEAGLLPGGKPLDKNHYVLYALMSSEDEKRFRPPRYSEEALENILTGFSPDQKSAAINRLRDKEAAFEPPTLGDLVKAAADYQSVAVEKNLEMLFEELQRHKLTKDELWELLDGVRELSREMGLVDAAEPAPGSVAAKVKDAEEALWKLMRDATPWIS